VLIVPDIAALIGTDHQIESDAQEEPEPSGRLRRTLEESAYAQRLIAGGYLALARLLEGLDAVVPTLSGNDGVIPAIVSNLRSTAAQHFDLAAHAPPDEWRIWKRWLEPVWTVLLGIIGWVVIFRLVRPLLRKLVGLVFAGYLQWTGW